MAEQKLETKDYDVTQKRLLAKMILVVVLASISVVSSLRVDPRMYNFNMACRLFSPEMKQALTSCGVFLVYTFTIGTVLVFSIWIRKIKSSEKKTTP